MKVFTLFLFYLLTVSVSAQNPFEIKPKPVLPPEEIHSEFDELPEFPGGPEAMQLYLEEHLPMPAVMRGVCSSRKLIVGFVVEKNGTLSQISIVKSINGCPDFDYDVLRAIKNMPKWTPGKIKRKYVRCYYKLPVYIG